MAAAEPSDVDSLRATTIEEDQQLLSGLQGIDALAVSFRIALKRALEATRIV